MQSIRVGLAVALVLALALTAACNNTARETWLHGAWKLSYNPGHDSDDELTFRPDGTLEIHTAADQRINGKYHVNDQTLILLVENKGDTIGVEFTISPDRARLTYESGAYYTRKDTAP